MPADFVPTMQGAPTPAAAAGESFGPTLAAARKARDLSEADVAAQLRLQVRQVRAIEAEDLERLPQGAYVRGFVRNYARLLGLSPEPLLASLGARLAAGEPLRPDDAEVVARSPVQLAAREHASRLTVIGGGVAALVVFAVAGWLAMRPVESTPEAVPPKVEAAAPAVEPAREREPQPDAGPRESAPATVPEDAAKAETASVAATPAVDSNELRFSFSRPSWVEVTQADGTVLLSRINDGGSQQTVVGTPPFHVVVGNASAVELEFRGNRVDLASVAGRNDVARLRLE